MNNIFTTIINYKKTIFEIDIDNILTDYNELGSGWLDERDRIFTYLNKHANLIVRHTKLWPNERFINNGIVNKNYKSFTYIFFNNTSKNIISRFNNIKKYFNFIETNLVPENYFIIYNENSDNNKVGNWLDLFEIIKVMHK